MHIERSIWPLESWRRYDTYIYKKQPKTKQFIFITQKNCDLDDTSIMPTDDFLPNTKVNCSYDAAVNVSISYIKLNEQQTGSQLAKKLLRASSK